MDFTLRQVTSLHILAYLEFLSQSKLTISSIANQLSAVQTHFALYALDSLVFLDSHIKYYNKALSPHKPFKVSLTTITDVPTLHKIVESCQFMSNGLTFKALYLLAFFSFLRISNLVPHAIAQYSPLQQLSRGDIFFAHPGLHILIKWSKTLQTKDKVKILKIHQLGVSPLCPVAAIK